MKLFEPIIRRWPTVRGFASDVGCSTPSAGQWIHNDSIPAAWFAAVVRASTKRGFNEITLDLLADRAEKRRLRREGEKAQEAA
jgi:hypothetical protein